MAGAVRDIRGMELHLMCDAPDHHPGEKPRLAGYTGPTRNWSGPFPKTPARLLGMGLIRFYQVTLSSLIGNSCRHTPTCSEYGYEAIARHGLWAGFWMALFRFMRCGPGGTWGIDPVPDRLDPGLRWYAPWRYWRVSKAERG